MRTELGLLHEYEADEGVINKGIDATQYQLLLVRKAVGEQRFALASGFQHAQLKNRINMMFKPSSKGWMRLSYLAILPLLAILVYSCNPSKKQQEPQPAAATESSSSGTKAASPSEDVTKAVVSFSDVEVKPSFKGGDANEFAKWVMSEFKYPQAAIDAGVQGRVLVQFTINTDGTMGDVEVVRGVSPELDAEALRVLTSCTEKWTPGMQNGKPVPVTFTMPINFQLR
jgi:TonB family protein